jgi:hypothetical protein
MSGWPKEESSGLSYTETNYAKETLPIVPQLQNRENCGRFMPGLTLYGRFCRSMRATGSRHDSATTESVITSLML